MSSLKKRGLGKGLNELLAGGSAREWGDLTNVMQVPIDSQAQTSDHQQQELIYLNVESLKPSQFQPRHHISLERLEPLAESIKAQGVLQPIVARLNGDHYEIVAGERRWRAAQLVNLTQVPVIVRQVDNETAMAMALIENIQREDLNPIEEAVALKRLGEEYQLTHLQIAETIGISRTSVTNKLRLLTLNPDVQVSLEQNQIEMGHARALLGLKGSLQSQVAKTVVSRSLSVRETERLVLKIQENASDESKAVIPEKVNDPNIKRLEDDLADKLGAKVHIRHAKRGNGMLLIRYNDVDELEGILAHFK